MTGLNMSPDELLSEAMTEFDNGNYDIAVNTFIELYEADINKTNILNNLYNCFITPNEAEFFDSYRDQIYEMPCDIPYDELKIDFIPISDTVYYIFDKSSNSFCGKIDISKYINCNYDSKTFNSLLICDLWNPIQFLDKYHETEYQKIYLCIEEDSSPLFYSFFKLPGFSDVFDMDRTVIFRNKSEYYDFFHNNVNSYIPRIIYGKNVKEYQNINSNLHNNRLKNPAGDNVFLTIGIPSYNRGHLVIQSIQHLLKLKYDSEIEILISNNGSTENTEGYNEIASMNDSRITYFRFDENQGARENIINVLKIGKGKFIMEASDEDKMYIENLDKYIDYLYNNTDAGFIIPSGTGNGVVPRDTCRLDNVVDRLDSAFHAYYLTGLTLNSLVLKNNNAFERAQQLIAINNLTAITYIHTIFLMIAAEKNYACESAIVLWDSPADQQDTATAPKILSYTRPQSRIEQQDAAVWLIFNFIKAPLTMDDKTYLFLYRIAKTFFVLRIAFNVQKEAMAAEYDWLDTCIMVWKHNTKLIKEYTDKLDSQHIDYITEQNISLFTQYINMNPSENVQTPKQINSYKMRRDELMKVLS